MEQQENYKRKRINPNYELIQSKLPPMAVDIEAIILGTILLYPDSLFLVVDQLKFETFYKEAHQKIYQAILDNYNENKPFDLITITQTLRETGNLEIIGGAYYIAQLTDRVTSSTNIEYHTKIIIQKYIQRELIRTGTEQVQEAYSDEIDVLELLAKSEKNLFAISETNTKKGFITANEVLAEAQKEISNAVNNKGKMIGLPTGFDKLNEITGGWQKSDLIIIAARPSIGKTALALNLIKELAINENIPIGIFSLEMSRVQLMNRFISLETNIDTTKLKNGRLDSFDLDKLRDETQKLANAPLFIDDTPAISLFDIRAKARRLKHQKGIKALFIDYLQLITPDEVKGINREQQVSTISKGIKSLARELNIPVILLSQLSREIEKRAGKDKKPILSDLRESGAIEQEADIVLFIYKVIDAEMNIRELIIAKHRNGAIGSVFTEFVSQLTKFVSTNYYSENKGGLDI